MALRQFRITSADGAGRTAVVVDRVTERPVEDIERIEFKPLVPGGHLEGRVHYVGGLAEMAQFNIGVIQSGAADDFLPAGYQHEPLPGENVDHEE